MIILILLPILCLVAGFAVGMGSAWLRPRCLGLCRIAAEDRNLAPELLEIKVESQPLSTTSDLNVAVGTGGEDVALPVPSGSLSDLPVPLPSPLHAATDIDAAATPFTIRKQTLPRNLFNSTACTPTAHLGNLMRAASHALDELESRSVLHRLTSADTSTLSAPTPSRIMFSPLDVRRGEDAEGSVMVPLPSDEVHMDEVDLLEKIGGGAFG